MPHVTIIAGSESDEEKIEKSGMLGVLNEVEIPWDLHIISAHRNADKLKEHVLENDNITNVYICIAGKSAALPGAVASYTRRPVIGVPLSSEPFGINDSLYPMISMPSGVPVAVTGVEEAGLKNAAIYACQIIADGDYDVKRSLEKFMKKNKKRAKINRKTSVRRKR